MYLIMTLMIVLMEINGEKLLPRILGGHDAGPEHYNNIVRMEMTMVISLPYVGNVIEFNHICTGTVLTSTWVLTASHCIEDSENLQRSQGSHNREVVIRYGSAAGIPWNNDSFSHVKEMIKHPSYQRFTLDTMFHLKNDIGLLKTAPITLDQYRKLSGMDYSTVFGQKTIAAGYGIMREGPFVLDTLTLNKKLQILDLLARKCEEEQDLVYPAICLSRRCGHTASVCPGDSGGPLLHPSGVVGVISMGMIAECFQTIHVKHNWFAIVTPVSPYLQWISNHISK